MPSYPVAHPRIAEGALQVHLEGFLAAPTYSFQGEAIKATKNRLSIRDRAGEPLEVQVKPGFPDAVPKMKVGDDVVSLVEPLAWYEYVWLFLPLALVGFGGAIGGGLGAGAAFANCRIFRSDGSAAKRYGITAGIALGAVALYFVIAHFVLQAIG